jgi:hypothetical protein
MQSNHFVSKIKYPWHNVLFTVLSKTSSCESDNMFRHTHGIYSDILQEWYMYFFPAQQPDADRCRLFLEDWISCRVTHHCCYDHSGRGIGPTQRPLPDYTKHLKQKTSTPVRDSNPWFQQASGYRSSSYTALSLQSADTQYTHMCIYIYIHTYIYTYIYTYI